MKKGFTLIELLAVILILGVIAVIVVPSVNSIIKKSKIKSFVASVEGLIDTAEIRISENELDEVPVGTLSLSDLEYKGKKYTDGQIAVNADYDVAIAVWDSNLKVCAYRGYNDPSVLVSTTITTEETCIVPGAPVNLCDGTLWTNIDFGDDITAYLDGTTLCLQGAASTATPVVIPESWGELAIEVTEYILDRYDSELFDYEEDVFTFAYLAYFEPIEWDSMVNGNNIRLYQLWDDVYENVVVMADVLSANPDFAAFVASIPYADPNTIGEIRNFNELENANALLGIENIILTGEITRVGNNAFATCNQNDIRDGFVVSNDLDFQNDREMALLRRDKKDEGTMSLMSDENGVPTTIVSVDIQANISEIGTAAFACNYITDVTLPNSVTKVGNGAFVLNLIDTVSLPTSLRRIETYAFAGNQLTNVVLPVGVTFVGENSFFRNQISDLTIPNTMKYISGFGDNQISTLNLPDGLITVGEFAFGSNQISSLTIPSTVTMIGYSAFQQNMLSSISIPASVEYLSGFNDNQFTSVSIPGTVREIGQFAFSYNDINSLTISNGVEVIQDGAFSNNDLTSVTIPNTVTYLTGFSYNSISSITIPSSVTTIGYGAFNNNLLTTVAIPNTVTSLFDSAFRYNRILQGDATIDNTLGNVFVGSKVFNNNGATSTTVITPVYLR